MKTNRRDYFRAYQRMRYAENKEQILAAQKTARKRKREAKLPEDLIPGPKIKPSLYERGTEKDIIARKLLYLARSRAKRDKIPCTLELIDIVIPDQCPALGISLKQNTNLVGADSYTLDQLVAGKGYTNSNVAVISHRANSIKNNATLEELKAIVTWLERILADLPKTSEN